MYLTLFVVASAVAIVTNEGALPALTRFAVLVQVP
jgi:hypothetical protein